MIRPCIIALIILFFTFASCKEHGDYSGIFLKESGNCSHKYIHLKKVQEFGDKYYLIYVYGKGKTWKEGKEFLGVVQGNKITINSSVITLNNGSIHIQAKSKSCIFKRIEGP